jgi:hypothetical protein
MAIEPRHTAPPVILSNLRNTAVKIIPMVKLASFFFPFLFFLSLFFPFSSGGSLTPSCPFRNHHFDCSGRSRPQFPSFLPIFQPSTFLQIFENMAIHVTGDSVSLQHFRSLVCELSYHASPSLQLQMKKLNLTEGRVDALPSWACVTFRKNFTLCWTHDVTDRGQILHKEMEPELLIWNAGGLHSKSESAHLEKLHRLLYYARTRQYYPFHMNTNATGLDVPTSPETPIKHLLLYRETTPQSFVGSLSGIYEQRNESISECQDILSILKTNEVSDAYLTYRQILEREFTEKKGIPFLPVHDLTLLRGPSQYLGFPDCSHFCDPGTPTLWNRMLYQFVTTSPLIKSLRRGKLIS